MENNVNPDGGFGLDRAGVLVYLQALMEARLETKLSQKSGLMQGKRGVILGVANNRSIAWDIAKA
jgi:enoyl-[acyl-carrier protein] reductase I